jgi:hypothetical protein
LITKNTEKNNERWKEARKLVEKTKKEFKELRDSISHGFEELDRKMDIQAEKIKAEFYINVFYKVTFKCILVYYTIYVNQHVHIF